MFLQSSYLQKTAFLELLQLFCHSYSATVIVSVLIDLLEVAPGVVLPGELFPVPGPPRAQVSGDLVSSGLLLGVALVTTVGEGVREDFWKTII